MKDDIKGMKRDMSYELFRLFWIFIFGCIFGCVYEMILTFIKTGDIVSRQGLIYGPLNPVYGFGAVIFMIILTRYKDIKIVFLIGSLAGGLFEYACSLFQEIFFNTVSWDYSNYLFNFHGRTSIWHAMFWGGLAIIFWEWVYPICERGIKILYNHTSIVLTLVLLGFVIVDAILSAAACYRQTQRVKHIPANNKVEIFLDTFYSDDFLNRVYPNAQRPK